MRPSVTLPRGLGLFALIVSLLAPLSVSAQGDATPPTAVSNGYPVSAYLCETDPGERFVAGDRPFPNDCQTVADIGVTISLEDGTVLGSCTVEDEICLVPNLPTDPGLLLVFTEDISTVPDGYAPRENPLSAGNYGEFRGVSFYNVATDADATGADASAAPAETMTAATDGSTVAIYAGDCDGDLADEPIATLTNVRAPSGDTQGADTSSAVETAFTTLDLPLDDLLADDHVLVVFDEDDDTVPLVCGAIGGIVTEDGSLAFGLPAVGASRFSGVAYLTQEDDRTLATLFLAEDLDGGDETPAA